MCKNVSSYVIFKILKVTHKWPLKTPLFRRFRRFSSLFQPFFGKYCQFHHPLHNLFFLIKVIRYPLTYPTFFSKIVPSCVIFYMIHQSGVYVKKSPLFPVYIFKNTGYLPIFSIKIPIGILDKAEKPRKEYFFCAFLKYPDFNGFYNLLLCNSL